MVEPTGLILLAGQDAVRKPEQAYEALKQRYRNKHEWYLWDIYKPMLLLEDLNHRRRRTIDVALEAALGAELIDSVVVVGKPQLKDYLSSLPAYSGVGFVQEGTQFGDNLELGYEGLADECPYLPRNKLVLAVTTDLPELSSRVLDELVAAAQLQYAASPLKPNLLLGVASKQLIGNYHRRFFPVWDNYFSEIPRRRALKESNFLLLNSMAKTDRFSEAYSLRNMAEWETWKRLPRVLVKDRVFPMFAFVPELITGSVESFIAMQPMDALLRVFTLELEKLNNRIARALGEGDSVRGFPRVLMESIWREISLDTDTLQDIAMLGKTLVGRALEYKYRVVPHYGKEHEAMRLIGPKGEFVQLLNSLPDIPGLDFMGNPEMPIAGQRGYAQQDSLNQLSSNARFLVSTWLSTGEGEGFFRRNREWLQLEKHLCKMCSLTPLGWYGAVDAGQRKLYML